MEIVKAFFMLFNNFSDLQIILVSLPFLWVHRAEPRVQHLFASLLYSFSLLVLMKGCFRIPYPQRPDTFSFPSGHCWMILSTSYFVFKALLVEKKQYLFWTSFFVLGEVGICLCLGYHTGWDCLWGIIFSILFLFPIDFMSKKISNFRLNSLISILFAIVIYFIVLRLAPAYAVKSFSIMTYYFSFIILTFFVSKIHCKK